MVKVLDKNTTKCGHCNHLLGFDDSDLVSAIKCPECNQLIAVDRPLPTQKDFGELSWKEIISEFKAKGSLRALLFCKWLKHCGWGMVHNGSLRALLFCKWLKQTRWS